MASQSIPISSGQSETAIKTRLSAHAPSARTATIVMIAVVILFRWLHLIVALQITSAGRQIQIKTEELRQKERAIAVLQQEIAVAESPQNLAIRASLLGYAPCTPVYIALNEPVAAPAAEHLSDSSTRATPGTEADPRRAFDTWLQSAQGP